MKEKIFAYCWQSGLIEFGVEVPEGAIAFAEGTNKKVREMVCALARHGYKKGVLLVPGIPEAQSPDEAYGALCSFVEWARKSNCRGFRVLGENCAVPEEL